MTTKRKFTKRKTDAFKRFWEKVGKLPDPNACWPWQASRLNSGYGKFDLNGHYLAASRAGWIVSFGPTKGGTIVLHICDHPWCCNPAHWVVGTALDNMRDVAAKGCSGTQRPPERMVYAASGTGEPR
jgi:HNH endonuclease